MNVHVRFVAYDFSTCAYMESFSFLRSAFRMHMICVCVRACVCDIYGLLFLHFRKSLSLQDDNIKYKQAAGFSLCCVNEKDAGC